MDHRVSRAAIDRLIYTVRRLRRPIFAAVNGLCLAGGCEIAESTDFIIASENARFGQPDADKLVAAVCKVARANRKALLRLHERTSPDDAPNVEIGKLQ
jgi:enoyl-CoA hydratase/carnithine racemase